MQDRFVSQPMHIPRIKNRVFKVTLQDFEFVTDERGANILSKVQYYETMLFVTFISVVTFFYLLIAFLSNQFTRLTHTESSAKLLGFRIEKMKKLHVDFISISQSENFSLKIHAHLLLETELGESKMQTTKLSFSFCMVPCQNHIFEEAKPFLLIELL